MARSLLITVALLALVVTCYSKSAPKVEVAETVSQMCEIKVEITSTPAAHDVYITFDSTKDTAPHKFYLLDSYKAVGNYTFTVDLSDLSSTAFVSNGNTGLVGDLTYAVQVVEAFWDAPSSKSNVPLFVYVAPKITKPVDKASGKFTGAQEVSFTLYQTPEDLYLSFLDTSGSVVAKLAFKSTFYLTGLMTIIVDTDRLTAAYNTWCAGITVGSAQKLVNGNDYTLEISYTKKGVIQTGSILIKNYVDSSTETVAPVLLAPASTQRLKDNVNVKFTLPECAKADSVKIKISHTGGAADSAADRVVNVAGQSNTDYEVLVKNSMLVGDNLVDGAIYSWTVLYQDVKGNPVANDAATNIEYDGEITQTPTLISPHSEEIFKENFALKFNLPEKAKDGSIMLKITPNSGLVDTNGPRTIVFSDSQSPAGDHEITMAALSTAASSVDAIASVQPAKNLVHHEKYRMEISYQDQYGYAAATSKASVHCLADFFVIPETLILPQTNSTMTTFSSVKFKIPEDPATGSVKITFRPANLTVATVHSHTFATIATKGEYRYHIVADLNINLVNDAFYTVELEYEDFATNLPKVVTATNVKYDSVTEPIIVTKPGSGSVIETFTKDNLQFTLPELGYINVNGTTVVTLVIDVNSGDSAGQRTVLFNLKEAQDYVFTLEDLEDFAGDNAKVVSVTPNNNLVQDASYNFTFSYQDQYGNSAAYTATNFVTANVTPPFVRNMVHVAIVVVVFTAMVLAGLGFFCFLSCKQKSGRKNDVEMNPMGHQPLQETSA